jgi:dTDP-4-dehydrorhamnose 3,5-epimerase
MPFEPMGINGAFIFHPDRRKDQRGSFEEAFKLSVVKNEAGEDFPVKQVNRSVSHEGVIRGIHFSTQSPGQAKYVSCHRGKIWDVVVDLRTGSPTFGKWEGIELTPENGISVLIAAGLGHAFVSLENDSMVSYLCSEEYNPASEGQIDPLDRDLGVSFQEVSELNGIKSLILSERDQFAPGFEESRISNILPVY